MNAASRWPAALWRVRHGESAGNVTLEAAHAAGHDRIRLEMRDADVPLSAQGLAQAQAQVRNPTEGAALLKLTLSR
jgi:broad specificity phosphatase PhoE